MSTDLEQALRNVGAELTLQPAVTDVLTRGAAIRRRRRRVRVVGAAAVLAAAGATATLVGSGEPTSPSPTATLRSSPEEQCRQMALEDAPIPDGLTPVLSSEHDGAIALVYVYDGRYAACTAFPLDGAWLGRDSATGPWRPLGERSYRALVFNTSLVVQVSDDVDRVTLEVGGSVAEADVQRGYAVVWYPASALSDDVVASGVVTAYDDEGVVLQQGRP